MESVTGVVFKISFHKLNLFPHLANQFLDTLCRGSRVDILIGIALLSWHTQRAEKANCGGDFFVCRGRFGACVGGSHPEMYEGTRRSNELFYVNHVYHINTMERDALEYCKERIKKATFSGASAQSCRQRSATAGSVPHIRCPCVTSPSSLEIMSNVNKQQPQQQQQPQQSQTQQSQTQPQLQQQSSGALKEHTTTMCYLQYCVNITIQQ